MSIIVGFLSKSHAHTQSTESAYPGFDPGIPGGVCHSWVSIGFPNDLRCDPGIVSDGTLVQSGHFKRIILQVVRVRINRCIMGLARVCVVAEFLIKWQLDDKFCPKARG